MTTFSDMVYALGGVPCVGLQPVGVKNYRKVDPSPLNKDEQTYRTITQAIAASVAGDVILIAPGSYDETVTVNKAKLTLIGLGGRGSVFIEATTAGAEAMEVTVDDVTLVNVGCDGDDTSSYALKLTSAARFRAYGCKIEGSDTALLLLSAAGDAIFTDCEFAWGVNGVVCAAGGPDPSTQIVFKNCRFHNISTVHITDGANTFANLQLIDCVFDAAEDGTEPTDYLTIDTAGTSGIVTGCRFATATNATGVLTIAADVQWVANMTEAGVSTARPS